jgi:hypothetical protein
MEQPKNFPTVTWSIGMAVYAIQLMPVLFVITVIAGTTVDMVFSEGFPDNHADWQLKHHILSIIQSALNAAIVTPMIVATHRFVILGEVAQLSTRNLFGPRFVHFFSLSLVYQAMFIVVGFPTIVFGYKAAAVVPMYILLFVGFWLAIRIIIVFPAAAVDAPGTSLRNAFDDTRGEAWGIFLTLLWIGLPLVVAALAIRFVIARLFGVEVLTRAAGMAGFAQVLSDSILNVVSVMSLAAAASYMFRGLGNRLKRARVES